jgi:hypothetical protein
LVGLVAPPRFFALVAPPMVHGKTCGGGFGYLDSGMEDFKILKIDFTLRIFGLYHGLKYIYFKPQP